MIVVGGIYAEQCQYPYWDRLYGSGMRAAVAISSLSPRSSLHSYVPDEWREDVACSLDALGLTYNLRPVDAGITFRYFHPFGILSMSEVPDRRHPDLEVEGDVILRFGMVEGGAKVVGRRVVYDPQDERPDAFWNNNSDADDLALVLNRDELLSILPKGPSTSIVRADGDAVREAASTLFDLNRSKNLVLIVKGLFGGAAVFLGDDDPVLVPSYAAETFFRIGQGDVFAAAFAYAWGECEATPAEAADYAARCSAFFVDGARLPIPENNSLPTQGITVSRYGKIRLMAEQAFEVENLLLDTELWIRHLDATPIVNLFEPRNGPVPVGDEKAILVLMGSGPAAERRLHVVPEVASGRSAPPVVVYWPDATDADRALLFPAARVTDDYATALYHVMRISAE